MTITTTTTTTLPLWRAVVDRKLIAVTVVAVAVAVTAEATVDNEDDAFVQYYYCLNSKKSIDSDLEIF